MSLDKPDYYNMSKPKTDKELRLRKCFRCGKEKKMGKFERYCSIACRNYATKHDTSSFKISWQYGGVFIIITTKLERDQFQYLTKLNFSLC